MPAEALGYAATLHLFRDRVVIVAERVLTELVHVRPRAWPDDVERLHELLGSPVRRRKM